MSRHMRRFWSGFALVLIWLALLGLIAPQLTRAQPSTPVASFAAIEELPEGALGEQIQWFVDYINLPESSAAPIDLTAKFVPEVFVELSHDQLKGIFRQIHDDHAPVSVKPGSMFVIQSSPPTHARFELVGRGGIALPVTFSIDGSTGLINRLFFGNPIFPDTSAATPLPDGITDTDISFLSGGDTIYGSFMAPTGTDSGDPRPAALIISGSGPSDRNGNGATYLGDTNRNLALTLADLGIPSLRYDKLGSGKTGIGPHAYAFGIGYDLYLREAKDAAASLANRPGVDPTRLILVGHSEGGLFALALAKALVEAGTPPAALILVAPLSERYLDVIEEQIETALAAQVAGGSRTQDSADAVASELQEIIKALRNTGHMPIDVSSQELLSIFTPLAVELLVGADMIDPAEVAAELPGDLPALVLLGEKDAQVTTDQVQHLMDGFAKAGNTNAVFVSLPNANHILKVVEGTPNPAMDYPNRDLPFSPAAVAAIDEFLAAHQLRLTPVS